MKRTSTGILSNRRPVVSTATSSGTATPDAEGPRLTLLASAKRDAAKKGLYAKFFRGPVLGPDLESEAKQVAATFSVTAETSAQPSATKRKGKKEKRAAEESPEERRERKRRKREAKAAEISATKAAVADDLEDRERRKRRKKMKAEGITENGDGDGEDTKEDRRKRKEERRKRREALADMKVSPEVEEEDQKTDHIGEPQVSADRETRKKKGKRKRSST